MAGFNQTRDIISSGTNYIPDISVGFSNVINEVMAWINRVSWYEWVLLISIIVISFGLYALRNKLLANRRKTIRYY